MEKLNIPDTVSHQTLVEHLNRALEGLTLSTSQRMENAWFRLPPGHPMKGSED